MERPALPAVILLLAFFSVGRSIGERTRPVEDALDCSHAAAGGTPVLERCVELRPDDVELMTELGDAYEVAAQWERAESIYRRALVADPEDGDLRVRLARLLVRRGAVDEARREGMAALALQPGGPAALEVSKLTGGGEQ
jgi:Flp pilus assembly protein TadD